MLVAKVYGGTFGEIEARLALIAAAPLGFDLAEAVLAQDKDGLDRAAHILDLARAFMAQAEGKP